MKPRRAKRWDTARAFGPFLFLAAILVLSLSACQTGGGYKARSWPPAVPQQVPDINSPAPPAETVPVPETPQQTPSAYGYETARTAHPVVKVGLLLPLTGSQSTLGQAMLEASQLALFNIAAPGFELIPHDTAGTAQGARQAAEDVIEDGAQIILGPVFSQSVRAVRPVAERHGVNMIAFSTDWSLAGGRAFLMGFMPFDQITRIMTYARRQNIQSVALLSPETDYGQVVSSLYRQAAADVSMRTPMTQSFSPAAGTMDFAVRSLVQGGSSAAPDGLAVSPVSAGASGVPAFEAVLLPMGGQMLTAASNVLTRYGAPPARVRRLGTGLMDDPALFHERSLNGAWFAGPPPRLRLAFENQFRDTYGYKPPRLSTLAYDATALAAVLAQRGFQSGRTPGFETSHIQNTSGFSGIDGIFRFENNIAVRGLAILEISQGRVRVIDPAPQSFRR